MQKLVSIALMVLFLVSNVVSAANPENIALSLVQKYRFGESFTSICYDVASQTQTYQTIVNKVGEQKAQSLVKSEIDKLIPEYQILWNKKLASAYAQVISAETLQSLANGDASAKYADELKKKQSEIALLMQAKSTMLLNDILTKAMTSAFLEVVSE